MKTKLLVLTAALIGAASLSANARLVYGQVLYAPAAPACAPVVVNRGHSDWRDAGRHDFDRHDYYRHDHDDHRR